ncbi:hypothetical protein [Actinokineospora sp. NBRC 105648]|uniref:hypothetical protein n=1 Tax=Actinokineospora sp. NBRC 105648 TaxID=3032206 RepID=UPI0024A141CD|nr:hypothetical protein [Actinokineospora sp. NBRC 105648]GLZ40883.1 hypothetical protein Acsp05_45070 [Actinokineospora sp. NBRC 105648]
MRRILGSVAVLVTAMVALVGGVPAGATAAARGAVVGDQAPCTEQYKWYSPGYWTYVKVRVCLTMDDAGDGRVRVETADSSYKGEGHGIWHDADPSYPATWSAYGTVANGDAVFGWSIDEQRQTSPDGQADSTGSLPTPDCGQYDIELNFRQTGPRWDEPRDVIDPGTQYATVVVC